MKKLYIILILSLFSKVSLSQVYDYPVKPGSDKWKNFNSTSEMINACQIPDKIINSISTYDLLKLCLEYPLLNNYTASNNPFMGFTNIVSSFNGLKEFINRKDSNDELIKYYLNKNISNIETSEDKGKYTFDFFALELMLAQKEIFEKFDIVQKKEILKILMSKYNDKVKFQEFFGIYGKLITVYVGCKYLQSLSPKFIADDLDKKKFLDNMIITDVNLLDEIIFDINRHLLNK